MKNESFLFIFSFYNPVKLEFLKCVLVLIVAILTVDLFCCRFFCRLKRTHTSIRDVLRFFLSVLVINKINKDFCRCQASEIFLRIGHRHIFGPILNMHRISYIYNKVRLTTLFEILCVRVIFTYT